MRAATAMKFAATTTRMLLSRNPSNPAFGERLAERERGELGVLALGVEQRLALLAEQHLLDLAEEDGVRAVRELFTTRQSNDTSASISTGEPVARRVQSRDLKRVSPLCAPLKLVESSQSSARSTLTQTPCSSPPRRVWWRAC